MAPLRVIEFFSGIGGMHCAAELAQWDCTILRAFDINATANLIYRHNFGNVPVDPRKIESLSASYYDSLRANVWTMSPPCQPYTRVGLQKGSMDNRARSFLHLMHVLDTMEHPPDYILVENVKGFEVSDSRDILVNQLEKSNYAFQEFLLTPLQMGIPNSRLRYYLLAKRKPLVFAEECVEEILDYIPLSSLCPSGFLDDPAIRKAQKLGLNITGISSTPSINPIAAYLENDVDSSLYTLSELTLLKHGQVLDIVKPSSYRSCCFTKGYFYYAKGTGSVLQMNETADTSVVFNEARSAAEKGDYDRQKELLHSLDLRYFTPREVSCLAGFPDTFTFPEQVSVKQRYQKLGNSINVRVVAELMQYLTKMK